MFKIYLWTHQPDARLWGTNKMNRMNILLFFEERFKRRCMLVKMCGYCLGFKLRKNLSFVSIELPHYDIESSHDWLKPTPFSKQQRASHPIHSSWTFVDMNTSLNPQTFRFFIIRFSSKCGAHTSRPMPVGHRHFKAMQWWLETWTWNSLREIFNFICAFFVCQCSIGAWCTK